MKSIIVVGGGILGASTAYHLARAGAQVILVDRQDQGQATDAAAGIVCPWLSQRRNQAWYQLAKLGAGYYSELINMLKEDGEKDTGFKRVGAISLHKDENKLDKLEERAYKRRQDAPEIGDITRLTALETKKIFPLLSDDYSAVHISGAARVNGRAIRNSMVNAAIRHGATHLQGDATLMMKKGKIIGIKLEEREIAADQVIVTAGAWANELLATIGINLNITSQKAQIVHLEMQETETNNWPVIMPPNDQYILSFDNGKIVIGATHENEVGFDQRVTAGGLQEILNKALTVAPGLSEGKVMETRVGFRPFTPGFLPVIGFVPNILGLLFANGLGASGLTTGPFLGAELAKLALGEETTIDLELYKVVEAIKK